MSKPNLFHFAKKELSQDAFLMWLISWARPECKKENPDLTNAAQMVLAEFTGLPIESLNFNDVKITAQEKYIDIVVRFGNYLIAIEDKVRAKLGPKQLERYSKRVDDICKGQIPFKILFKTHVPRNWERKAAQDAKFEVFDLKRIQDLLQEIPHVKSEIYNDFKSNITEVYSDIYDFASKPTKKWSLDCYHGLCLEVSERLKLSTEFNKWHSGKTFWYPLAEIKSNGQRLLSLELKNKKMILTGPVQNHTQYTEVIKKIYSIFPLEEEEDRKRRAKNGNNPTLFIFKKTFVESDGRIDLPKTIGLFKERINKLRSLQ